MRSAVIRGGGEAYRRHPDAGGLNEVTRDRGGGRGTFQSSSPRRLPSSVKHTRALSFHWSSVACVCEVPREEGLNSFAACVAAR